MTEENPVTQDQATQPEPSVCTGACCAQPDGIDPDSYDLPDPAAAAERVGDFLTEFGDGMITVYELDKLEGVPPLYARDLEALRKLAADDELIHVSLLHNAGFDVCTACNGSGFRNGVECAECSLRRIKPRTAAQAPAASEQPPCPECGQTMRYDEVGVLVCMEHGTRTAASEDTTTPGWVRVLRARTGLPLTSDSWGHWCCQAGAMAAPGPCPWHPAANGDILDQAAAVLHESGCEDDCPGNCVEDARKLAARGLLADSSDRARIEKALELHSPMRWYGECTKHSEDQDPNYWDKHFRVGADGEVVTCEDCREPDMCKACTPSNANDIEVSPVKHPCPTRVALAATEEPAAASETAPTSEHRDGQPQVQHQVGYDTDGELGDCLDDCSACNAQETKP